MLLVAAEDENTFVTVDERNKLIAWEKAVWVWEFDFMKVEAGVHAMFFNCFYWPVSVVVTQENIEIAIGGPERTC